MEWYYANDRHEQVPCREEDLPRLVLNGHLQPDTLVWHEGLPQWTPCRTVRPDLFSHLPAAAPPALPAAAPPALPSQMGGSPQRPPAAAVPTDGLSVASLILGILGLVSVGCYGIGVPFSIAAIICGHIAKRGLSDPSQNSNRSMSVVGLVIGYIGFAVAALMILALLGFVALGAVAESANPTTTP